MFLSRIIALVTLIAGTGWSRICYSAWSSTAKPSKASCVVRISSPDILNIVIEDSNIILEMNNNNTAANAVGSSGGSLGIMPKLKAMPTNQAKRKEGVARGVFEMSSRDE